MPSIYKVVLAPTTSHTVPTPLSGDRDTEIEETTNTGKTYLVDPYAEYTMCADVNPYWDYTGVTSFPCLLTIHNLLSGNTGHIIGNYVIEWHLNSVNGTIVLISGNSGNTDSSIQVWHPFDSIPVSGGILYPVIKYMYVNTGSGFVKYTSLPTSGALYSPDLLTCLDPISILDLTCYNGGSFGNYTQQVSYYYDSQNPSPLESTKVMTFQLNSGGTTKYFAWLFNPYTVADTYSISYMRSNGFEIPLESYSYYLYKVTPLEWLGYLSGDYLKLTVTANAGNINTYWLLQMKCMSGFTCPSLPNGFNSVDLTSLSLTYTSASGSACYFTANFNMLATASLGDFSTYVSNSYIYTSGDPYFYWGTGYTISTAVSVATTCSTQNNTLSVVKVGTGVTFTFQNSTDYSYYKSSLIAATGNTNIQNYTSDNTQVNYYKYLWCYLRLSQSNTCGDDNTYFSIYWHPSSDVVYNDSNKTIYIGLRQSTLGVTSESCNNKYTYANSVVGTSNITYNQGNWSYTTSIKNSVPFGSYYLAYNSTQHELETIYSKYCWIYKPYTENIGCSFPAPWYVTSNYYRAEVFYLKFVITDDSSTSAPPNNFEVYSGLNYDGYLSGSWSLIYKKVGGVQTYP